MGRVAGAGKWVPPAMVCRDPLPRIHSPLPCTHLLLRVGATAVPPAEREPESFTAQTWCSQCPPQAPKQGLVPTGAQQHGQDESQFPQHGDTAWQGRAGWLQRCREEWVQVWVPRGVWDARGGSPRSQHTPYAVDREVLRPGPVPAPLHASCTHQPLHLGWTSVLLAEQEWGLP